jgi:hypothetical protein
VHAAAGPRCGALHEARLRMRPWVCPLTEPSANLAHPYANPYCTRAPAHDPCWIAEVGGQVVRVARTAEDPALGASFGRQRLNASRVFSFISSGKRLCKLITGIRVGQIACLG